MTFKPSTPLATAQIAVAGCALMVLSYPLSFLPFASAPGDAGISHALWVGRYELLCVLLPGILGIVISWRYASLFSKGVLTGVWTYAQLDLARRWIESRPIRYTQTILILTFLVVMVLALSLHHGRHFNVGFTYIFISALNPISSMRRAVSIPPAPGPSIDWRESAPVHSNHWGQPTGSLPTQ